MVIGVACSEAAPEKVATNTTKPTAIAVDCDADLLACARTTTIAKLVPKAATKATGKPITLGMINQENTPAGSFPELSGAVQSGVAFINEQLGGIDGRPLKVEVCNTKFSAEGSTSCGQQFVDEKVPAVLGGIDVFGNSIDVLRDNDIPFVGGIPVSDQSFKSPNSFQWSGGTVGAAVAFADYSIKTLKAKRVAIIYGDFGSIAESAIAARKVLERAGVKVQMVPTPILATDMSSPLQAANAGNPDAIFVLAADTGCKTSFEAAHTLNIKAQAFYVGACAAPTILNDIDPAATNGTIFNVEGPVDQANPDPDTNFYSAVVRKYGKGLDPIGAGTVSFRSFMNLYVVMRGLGADGITAKAITDSLRSQVDAVSFAGHNYTCDGKQFEGLPALCSPQQVLVKLTDGTLEQIGDWIDVGAVYAG